MHSIYKSVEVDQLRFLDHTDCLEDAYAPKKNTIRDGGSTAIDRIVF